MDDKLTHLDGNGAAHMVNVGGKAVTERVAIARSIVRLAPKTLALLAQNGLPKGDAMACARIGAILAAKKTPDLIPLCHSLALTSVDIDFEIDAADSSISIFATARCIGKTGVEMEAIVAAQTAAAIIYDMCKAVQRDIVIADTRLMYKAGGKSGEFTAPGFARKS